ncbi:hypothetical protein BGZ76_006668 [Entomortierella beljakovae]|nr:hypothetical protein BGZ76_006668 [Entomortierella beljakovae]
MEESHPFLASSPNSTQEAHAPDYQSVDIKNKNKNKNKCGNNCSTSYFSSDSDSEQELIGPVATSSLTSSNSSESSIQVYRFKHHIRMLLAVVSQLGLFIYFGALVAAMFKAPWVYPYTWHPIFMGLYGFIATEAILILQPVETASKKQSARAIHGYLQTLALIFSLVGFYSVFW